jgi:hypothetical protein
MELVEQQLLAGRYRERDLEEENNRLSSQIYLLQQFEAKQEFFFKTDEVSEIKTPNNNNNTITTILNNIDGDFNFNSTIKNNKLNSYLISIDNDNNNNNNLNSYLTNIDDNNNNNLNFKQEHANENNFQNFDNSEEFYQNSPQLEIDQDD